MTPIKQLRQKAKLTVQKLASLLGCSPAYASAIERGLVAKPSDRILKRLAKALSVSEDYIYKLWGRISPEVVKCVLELLPNTLAVMRAVEEGQLHYLDLENHCKLLLEEHHVPTTAGSTAELL